MPLSIILILIDFHSILFFLLYLLCGLTDVLDGYLARKWSCATDFGAKLDSAADLLMCLMIFITIIRQNPLTRLILIAVSLIALIKFANAVIAKIKFNKVSSIHTIGNKVTGLLLYLCPLFYTISGNALFLLTGILAFLSSVEESLILISSKTVDINRKSIFTKS